MPACCPMALTSVTRWSRPAGACGIGNMRPGDTVLDGLEKEAQAARKGLWADSRLLSWGHPLPGHFISPNPHLAHAWYLEEYTAC